MNDQSDDFRIQGKKMATPAISTLTDTLPTSITSSVLSLFGQAAQELLSELAIVDIQYLYHRQKLGVSLTIFAENKLALPFGPVGELIISQGQADQDASPGLYVELWMESEPYVRIPNAMLTLALNAGFLHPVDGADDGVRLICSGDIEIDSSLSIRIVGFEGGRLDPVEIGNSGIIISSEQIKIDFERTRNLPEITAAGFDESFVGVYIGSATVTLPSGLPSLAPQDLVLKNCVIGSNGVSGILDAQYSPSFNEPEKQFYPGPGAGELFGIPFGLEDIVFEFKQNCLVQSTLKGQMFLPFVDELIELDLSIDLEGKISARISGADQDGTISITKKIGGKELFRLDISCLELQFSNGLFVARLSGEITPLIGEGIKWPTFEVRELSIDSKGHIHFDGGWMPLPKAYTLDFHGAKVEVTQFNMGHTDDGGKFIALSGSVELVKNIPAGASVEGLRIVWYDDGRDPSLSFNGIGVEFAVPNAIEFKGHVSYEKVDGGNRFTGDLEVTLPSVDLKLIGKAIFGKKKDGTKYFAIYLEGDFGTGIPLFSTGVSLYGFAGLLAINYAPDKPPEMQWYAIDKSKSWFHKPEKGITDIENKWQMEQKALAIGAGVTIGTTSDNGYSFNGKFLLMLLLPGPVIMFEGSVRLLEKRDASSEPPFHGLIVLDNRAGSFLIGLDAKWKFDKNQGNLAEISGSVEAYFSFHDPTAWHFWIGKREPREQRIQASFAKAFTANAYFMLDAKRLALGAWVGKEAHFKWGPVKGDMEAWLDTNASVNFKPSQFHADLTIHGYLAIRVFRFKLGFGLDALLSGDVFKPFHILGILRITIETPIKDFEVELRLEWGPKVEAPDLTQPELLPAQNCGLIHAKSGLEWPFEQGKTPVVPMDVRPYLTFAYPVHDEIGVGVNSGPNPGWQYIGDPGTQQGSARVQYRLTKIELHEMLSSGQRKLIAARPLLPNSPDVGELYGSWAPSPSGSAGRQNKLLVWSKNPLDFGDKTSSWNPWISSNLPNYPCPDVKEETVCFDFRRFKAGEQLHGAWVSPEKPDFRVNWSDGRPKPIRPIPGLQRRGTVGLYFGPPQPRKPYRAYIANSGDNNVVLLDLETRKVIATIPTGQLPRDVVVSADGKRAYVCNRGANTLTVIDTTTNSAIGFPITIVKNPVSIALTQDGKLAFVPSSTEPLMSVINLQALQVIATIKMAAVANRAVLTPDGKKGFVLHGRARKISVFSPQLLTVTTILDAPGEPEGMVFHPSQPRAWVSFPALGEVWQFDVEKDQFGELKTATGKSPRDMAISRDGSLLYVANLLGGTVSVLDTTLLNVIASIPAASPFGLEITPDGSLLLVSNFASNTISVIDARKNRVILENIAAGKNSSSFAAIEGPPGVETIACAANLAGNSVSIVNLQSRATLATIPVGARPTHAALTPDSKYLCVCCADASDFRVIDLASSAVAGTVSQLGNHPYSFAISQDGKRAYVGNARESRMSVIDLASLKVVNTVSAGEANHVLLSRDGKKCYVVNPNGITIITTDTLTITKIVPAPVGISRMALHPSLPRAFVSCPQDGSVRGFDLTTETFTDLIVKTGAFSRDICYSPNGAVLYVANLNSGTVVAVDLARGQIAATIPVANPVSPVFSPDGSQLLVASLWGDSLSIIDPAKNQVIGAAIPNPGNPHSIASLIRSKTDNSLPGNPIEVRIDVPKGSATVEVTWQGEASLLGTVLKPAGMNSTITAESGKVLKFDAAGLGLKAPGKERGIDQIRLTSDSDWTLIRVCVTKPAVEGGLAELTRIRDALKQHIEVWEKPAVILDPDKDYRLTAEVMVQAEGLGELSGWSTEFPYTKTIPFKTAQPPSLPLVPDSPTGKPERAMDLTDLSLYVDRTIPLSQPAKGELPALTKPVFRSYDVTVEFNENYVDQLYRRAGRDLDLILFDCNNQPVRDASGRLVIIEDAWDNAPELRLTETQARWIEMLNLAGDGSPCAGLAIDPTKIQTSKTLGSRVYQVLESDTVYEARLVPRLTRRLQITDPPKWIKEGTAFEAWTAPGGDEWTDYRVSVVALLKTTDAVTVFFRKIGSDCYEFTVDPSSNRRTLSVFKNGNSFELASDHYQFRPGKDAPHRIAVEAIGSRILVSQNGQVVFNLDVAELEESAKKTLVKGTAGLRRPIGQAELFSDFGISDFQATALVAYRFQFTTSKYASFYHQIHSHQGEQWKTSLVGGPQAADLLKTVGTDQEWRAFEEFSSLVLGSSSLRDPQQLEVTRVERGGGLLGWFLRGSEPIDRKRTTLSLATASRRLPAGSRPGSIKITEAEFGTVDESVTLLARDSVDLSGCEIQYRLMPAALDDERSRRLLWKSRPGVPILPNQIHGDLNWGDYRIKAFVRSSRPGEVGLRFRQADEKNFYSFILSPETGQQKIVRTVNGVASTLKDTAGDPSLGLTEPIVISLIGSAITIYRNEKKVLEITDSKFGRGGVSTIAAAESQADIFSLEVREQPNEAHSLYQGHLKSSSITGWQSSSDGLKVKLLVSGSWADCAVRTRVTRFNSSDAGILLRYVDPQNHYRFIFGKNDRRLERVAGGVVTILWQLPGVPVSNRTSELSISFAGSRIQVFMDSILIAELSDTQLKTGGVGICARADAAFGFSQFTVYPADLRFAQWTSEEEFATWIPERWTIIDPGQGSPSKWNVKDNRLVQTGGAFDADPVKQRGTMAILKRSRRDYFRLVTNLRVSADGPVGIVFGYQDKENFHRLSFDQSQSVRRLVRFVDGTVEELWKDNAGMEASRDHVLTLDWVEDDCLRAWLDGDAIFDIKLPRSAKGDVGFYCSVAPNASFGHLRIGEPAWGSYYSFGHEPRLSAGERVRVSTNPTTTVTDKSAKVRNCLEAGEAKTLRLPINGACIRAIDPLGAILHLADFLPREDFQALDFTSLWEADGTGILIIPTAQLPPKHALRVQMLYRRDNRSVDPNSIVFTQAGSHDDEIVYFDVPSDAAN